MAEEVGFEPTVPCGTTVFKTAAFDHSATPPRQLFQPMSPFRRGGLRMTYAGQAKTMRNRLEVKLIYQLEEITVPGADPSASLRTTRDVFRPL